MTAPPRRQAKPKFKQVTLEVPIKLTLHPSKIQLNQQQTLQIAELNQQIQSLTLTKPDTVAFDNKIDQINLEISDLHQRIEALQEQIHSKAAECQDYEEQNQMMLIEMRTRQKKIDDLKNRRLKIEAELEQIARTKRNHFAGFSDVTWIDEIVGFGNRFDQLAEIDERIERKTLTTPQLRKSNCVKSYVKSEQSNIESLKGEKVQVMCMRMSRKCERKRPNSFLN
jgi:hypothetical protein